MMSKPCATVLATLILLTIGSVTTIFGEDWPCWRGPSHDGLSSENGLPVTWTKEKGLAWKAALPGRGHSSPIVKNEGVFITACDETTQERVLLKLNDRTGEVEWKNSLLRSPLEGKHPLNSFASSTPAADEDAVYVTFLDGAELYVAACDFTGEKRWEARPGSFSSKHGFCSSPVLYRDTILINGDHDGESYLAALDRSTGTTLWKVPRDHKTRSYSVPRILTIDGRDQVVLTGSFATSGFDARTGELLWHVDGPSEQMVASILERKDLIFAMGGYPERHLLAIRKGGMGDVTRSHIVWRTHRSIPYVPSALLYGDYLHVVSDEGIYTCFDPDSGKVFSNKRVSSHISSSLVGGDGKVYITDDRGITTVIENGPSMKVLARNELGEDVYASPALSGGAIFLRGDKHLYRIVGDKPSGP